MSREDNAYVPLYVQIKEYIATLITEQKLKPHSKLPAEIELMRQFKCSRITVTTAMRELVNSGVVYRMRGKGSYVASPKLEVDIAKLGANKFALKANSIDPKGFHKLISAKTVIPTQDVASSLQLDPNQSVVRIERVRYIFGHPSAVEFIYLPEGLYPGLLEKDLESSFILDLLREEYHLTSLKSVLYVEPSKCTKTLAEQLGGKVGAPVLLCTQESFGKDDKPIFMWQMCTLGEHAKYVIRFEN